MTNIQQNLQEVFDRIDEIASYFVHKQREKEDIDFIYQGIGISETKFSFHLVENNGVWGDFFEFNLEDLEKTPASLYKAWNSARIAEEKAEKSAAKELARLKKTADVKKYIELTYAQF